MSDYRHDKRIKVMQDLFACTFNDQNTAICLEEREPDSTIYKILTSLTELDAEIQVVAPERPLSEINQVDLAILRSIVFESKHKDTPKKVLINEAIEMAKEFGSESSSRFINGALATLLLPEGEEATNEETTEKEEEYQHD